MLRNKQQQQKYTVFYLNLGTTLKGMFDWDRFNLANGCHFLFGLKMKILEEQQLML